MFLPSDELLKKYADVLVKFALRSGDGVKKDDVVFVQIPECAKPFYLPLQKAILEAGAHPIFQYLPDGVTRHFFDHAQDHQIIYYPKAYFDGQIQNITHRISIIAETDKYELKGVDPKKLTSRMHSRKEYKEKLFQKEREGNLTWVIGLYGTIAMADEVGLSLKEYWDQIIKACYLDYEDPISQWKKTFQAITKIKDRLNNLPIQRVKIKGKDVDLKIKIGTDRKRVGGGGRNIPSFEIFTSPDCRGTEGWIRFNQPLYVYGQLIKGIRLEFENGNVVKFSADENEYLLKEIISIPGADKVGEFSLTDNRLSHITKFMGETLYDENIGGKFGNTHIALGSSYSECFLGDDSKLNEKELQQIGFNQSSEHKDIISTTDRVVTAILENGEEKIIYKDGQFQI
ncbi:MAG: aminopeptidase [Candidatus Absconditabacterales bacterium]